MPPLAVTLPPDLDARLHAVATQSGYSIAECLALAVREFVETWETHLADVHQIDAAEARAVLAAPTDPDDPA